MRYTLKKQDRLTFRKDIEYVFQYGKILYMPPIKLVYYIEKNEKKGILQCGFSVSKKLFIRANKRNRIKRLMRDIYRLQKHYIDSDKNIKMMMIYSHKNIVSYKELFPKIGNILSIVNQQL
ncbi:MAG: ribonuclease P protein component [Chitinophagaceae bacterium]